MADTDAPVVVRFHRSLYLPDAVRTAAGRFGALGTVTVEDRDADTIVAIAGVPPHLRERVADELANHTLHQTVRDRRA
jgi:hypothetical protein